MISGMLRFKDDKLLYQVIERGLALMDWKNIEADWHRIKIHVKERWEKLSAEDLDTINGNYDALNAKIQDRYGLKEEHATLQLDEWYNNQQWLS